MTIVGTVGGSSASPANQAFSSGFGSVELTEIASLRPLQYAEGNLWYVDISSGGETSISCRVEAKTVTTGGRKSLILTRVTPLRQTAL